MTHSGKLHGTLRSQISHVLYLHLRETSSLKQEAASIQSRVSLSSMVGVRCQHSQKQRVASSATRHGAFISKSDRRRVKMRCLPTSVCFVHADMEVGCGRVLQEHPSHITHCKFHSFMSIWNIHYAKWRATNVARENYFLHHDANLQRPLSEIHKGVCVVMNTTQALLPVSSNCDVSEGMLADPLWEQDEVVPA